MLEYQTTFADYFPLAIASGKAFCNRENELANLSHYIQHQRPVLLVSPRRYGKTSLALRAIEQTKLPYTNIDLFSVVDESDLEKIILKGIGKLLMRLESVPKKALNLATEIFSTSHISVTMGQFEIAIENSRTREKPAYHILDLLERLEKLAEKTDKKIILFFDEFQRITEIASSHSIESVLRQVAQLTKTISFIFSGSNRHLLNKLFDDRNRPFYKLCERINLDRISVNAYEKYIQQAAKKAWGNALSSKVIERILHYTEQHSYYVNHLCSRFCSNVVPTEENVERIWSAYVNEEKSSVGAEMDLLSRNQRKLLTMLARVGGTTTPLGNEFIQQANMSKTTINQSLEFLVNKDYVFKREDGKFVVLDPLIKAVLNGWSMQSTIS